MITFGSRNMPIKPFNIATQEGNLQVREAVPADYNKVVEFETAIDIECFKACSSLKRDTFARNKVEQENLDFYFKYMNPKFNANSTLLIAEDQNKSIRASFSIVPLDNCDGLTDYRTGLVNTCMVDSSYRGNGVGNKIFSKLAETTKGEFTDLVVHSYFESIEFYKKVGFTFLNKMDQEQKSILNIIKKKRPDFNWIEVMHKPLEGDSRWWQRIVADMKL